MSDEIFAGYLAPTNMVFNSNNNNKRVFWGDLNDVSAAAVYHSRFGNLENANKTKSLGVISDFVSN